MNVILSASEESRMSYHWGSRDPSTGVSGWHYTQPPGPEGFL